MSVTCIKSDRGFTIATDSGSVSISEIEADHIVDVICSCSGGCDFLEGAYNQIRTLREKLAAKDKNS